MLLPDERRYALRPALPVDMSAPRYAMPPASQLMRAKIVAMLAHTRRAI